MRSWLKSWSKLGTTPTNGSEDFSFSGASTRGSAFGASSKDSDGIHNHSGWDDDREATRYLSARTLLSIPYASFVVRRVVNERFRALAPSYGVDVAIVTKWALQSLRLRRQRDSRLVFVFIIGLILTLTLLFVWPWASIAAVISDFAVGWVIVGREYLLRYHWVRAYMLRGGFDPAAAPEPIKQSQRDRLATIARRRSGNLIVFRRHNAFVGSGAEISREHLVIDASRGKKQVAESGKIRRKPIKFTNHDVHLAIMAAMRKLGLTDLNVEERLFVNGRHVHGNKAIFPEAAEPPAASVDCSILRQAAIHPTPDARVYVCVEMPSWQGQLIVTMFARAVHTGGSLYIEWRFHVLAPVRRVFQSVDNQWIESASRTRRRVFWRSLGRTPQALCGSPAHILLARRQSRQWRRYAAEQAESIERGQVFDYGALPSIREEAAGAARQHYFLRRDETMFVLLAQEKLIRAVSKFLDKMNIDTGQLASQIDVIVTETHKHYSFHVGGDVSNSNIAVGDKAQAGKTSAK